MIIDTHIFLWWLFDDVRLPIKIKKYIGNINHTIYVSSASVWEISTKFRLGKLPEAWDILHRDPFDRMLAAQSKLENLPLASIDKAMTLFPIKVNEGLE